MENYVYLIIAEADCPLILFEDNKRKSVNIQKKERKTTGVNRVNIISCKCEVWMTK